MSGVGYRLEESLEYRTLLPEALSIWRMAGANRMLFDCFDVDSKAARRSVAILSSCLRIECWGRDVVLRALNSNGRALLAPLSETVRPRSPACVTATPCTGASPGRVACGRVATPAWPVQPGGAAPRARNAGRRGGPVLLGGLFSFDLAEQFEPLPAPAEPARHCPDYLFTVPELLLDIDHLARRTSLQAFVHDPAGHDRLAASLRQCADEFHGAVEEASESPVAGVRAGNYRVD